MASRQGSPSRTFGLSLSTDSSAVGAVASDSEPSRVEDRESRSLFPSSLKPRLGRRDYLEKAGELIKLALKKEEEDDYEAASDFYRSSPDQFLFSSLRSESDRLGQVEVVVTAQALQESLFHISSPCSGANKEHSAYADTATSEEVLLFTEPTKEEANSLFQRDSEAQERGVGAGEADKEIHQIFEDLDKRLAASSRFFIPEGCIQRWAAEMVVALDALHREGIVCRDLNPNNILLNDGGHIQLTYFSRWSEVEDSCDSDAVARMYCAPEVGAVTEETEACDWWSLGAVLFELLTGKTLVECHPAGINTHTTLNMPGCVSEEARSLIQQLLQFNPMERLGAGVAGVEDIKSHPFFTPVDWAELTR